MNFRLYNNLNIININNYFYLLEDPDKANNNNNKKTIRATTKAIGLNIA